MLHRAKEMDSEHLDVRITLGMIHLRSIYGLNLGNMMLLVGVSAVLLEVSDHGGIGSVVEFYSILLSLCIGNMPYSQSSYLGLLGFWETRNGVMENGTNTDAEPCFAKRRESGACICEKAVSQHNPDWLRDSMYYIVMSSTTGISFVSSFFPQREKRVITL